MRVLRAFGLAVAMASLLHITPSTADVVYERNGSKMRGVVMRQSDSEVVLRIGAKMRLHFSTDEIERVHFESERVNAAIQSQWTRKGARPVAIPPRSKFARREDEYPAPEEWAAATPEQKHRNEVIEEIDVIEGSLSPAELEATLGEPLKKVDGRTAAGQRYRDLTYDIGEGRVRIVRFREMHSGFVANKVFMEYAEDQSDEAAPDGK